MALWKQLPAKPHLLMASGWGMEDMELPGEAVGGLAPLSDLRRTHDVWYHG